MEKTIQKNTRYHKPQKTQDITMACSMELVWELEKVDIEKAILTMKEGASDIRKCYQEQISSNTKGYFMKRVREQQMENMEEEVEKGIISEGDYINYSNRLARITIDC